ncbi:MAG TPA: hypothetical protein PK511_12655 [Chitinophagales bacterium]|nr:hypothetical protein [Chitinophagales bacterium]HMZ89135.1 hypothetical protein [Chitinophagales bacterium]HNE44989.1 hypothetical protein [Chitinophagales bacterium]HNI55368.1 hypothetical protein [Chitinophagales bacterium]HNJ88612.1 hypothetical protein [Chitinophagales bacterium]
MRKVILPTLLLIATVSSFGQASFDHTVIEVGNLGMYITNAGTLGRPDVRNTPTGDPSMEYPINSGIEHLFEGGFWIGAIVDGQYLVSTSAKDAASGYTTGLAGYEFTSEIGNTIAQRSSLTSSDYFNFDAISHQDLLVDISDKNVIVPGTAITIADHTQPLYADIHLETYAWNYSFADYFVLLNYTITNNSTSVWDSVWCGIWNDMVVRNVNVSTDYGSAFFSHGGYGYLGDDFTNYAFDVDGDPGFTNAYGAFQFLGIEWRDQFIHPNNNDLLTANGYPAAEVNSNFWIFNSTATPPYNAPANDVERYDKLKQGLNYADPDIVEFLKDPSTTGGLTNLLSAGPMISVEPGETFHVVFAAVCAKQIENGGTTGVDMDTPEAQAELLEHLSWSKRTYLGEDQNENGLLDIGEDLDADTILDRYILPEPPATPKMKVIADDQRIDIYWDNRAEFSVDPISKEMDFEGYRLYRTQPGDDFNLNLIGDANMIAQWDLPANGIGFNNGFSAIALTTPEIIDEDTFYYKYTLDPVLNGWQYLIILTAFDRGDEDLHIESLESSFIENAVHVFPGTSPNNDANTEIGVYPNPYRLQAAWDGSTGTTGKIMFYNLPEHCTISIMTLSGDIVAELNHDAATYTGSDSEWFATYAGNEDERIFSGGEHAWNLLSESNQTITQGIYLFSVKDLDNGNIKQGRFAIIK